MRKYVVLSILSVAGGIAFAATGTPREVSPLNGGTVLDPFRLQVVPASEVTPLPTSARARPSLPLNPDPGPIRPVPFTPPPRSPFIPAT